jgi:hypothetical protein
MPCLVVTSDRQFIKASRQCRCEMSSANRFYQVEQYVVFLGIANRFWVAITWQKDDRRLSRLVNLQSGVQATYVRHQIVRDYHVGKSDLTKFNERSAAVRHRHNSMAQPFEHLANHLARWAIVIRNGDSQRGVHARASCLKKESGLMHCILKKECKLLFSLCKLDAIAKSKAEYLEAGG